METILHDVCDVVLSYLGEVEAAIAGPGGEQDVVSEEEHLPDNFFLALLEGRAKRPQTPAVRLGFFVEDLQQWP